MIHQTIQGATYREIQEDRPNHKKVRKGKIQSKEVIRFDCETFAIIKKHSSLYEAARDLNKVYFKNKKNAATIANSLSYRLKRTWGNYCGECVTYREDFENVKFTMKTILDIKLNTKYSQFKNYMSVLNVYVEYVTIMGNMGISVLPFKKFCSVILRYANHKIWETIKSNGDLSISPSFIGEVKYRLTDKLYDYINDEGKIAHYRKIVPHWNRKKCTAKFKSCYTYVIPKKQMKTLFKCLVNNPNNKIPILKN